MKTYNHIFFDLDHTLWDFDKNSNETLRELIEKHQINRLYKIDPEAFLKTYRKVNKQLWTEYNQGSISKEELRIIRFQRVLDKHRIENDELAAQLDEEYIASCPLKGNLIEGTVEVLDYLKPKYTLHIISNGFEETQFRKVKAANIDHYFDEIITSETYGIQKPDSRIFSKLIDKIGTKKQECLMIGDNLHTDMIGAQRSGIDQVFYNPLKTNHNLILTYQITKLIELKAIL
ncbi:MAG: YjjG family noncanonical pyrimidine nucleotidase [Cyclobacteriaceae bacterium]